MNRNVEMAYDCAYLKCIKDIRDLIKHLSDDYTKNISALELKNQLRDFEERFIGFTKVK